MGTTVLYKNAALVFAFVIGFAGMVNAQQLQLKNTANGKIRTIKTNQKFSFKLSDSDEFSKGKIQSFTDSSIVLFLPEEDDIMLREVKLSEFYSIKKISGIHKLGYFVGALLMVGGAASIVEAPGIAGENGSDWLVRGIGAVGLAAGLVPYLIKPTEFVQGKNAEFRLVGSGQ